MDITIIADNGGGLTLQLIAGSKHYQHCYEDAAQCARDIHDAQADGTFAGWDGNEAEDEDGNDMWLYPSDDHLRNGGYRILTPKDLPKLTDDAWRNIRDLALAY